LELESFGFKPQDFSLNPESFGLKPKLSGLEQAGCCFKPKCSGLEPQCVLAWAERLRSAMEARTGLETCQDG
jgi:hypothetical protein